MDAWRGFAENAVSDREHGRIAADDQRNQDHGGGADRGRLRQDAASEAEILEQLLEPRRYPHRSRVLFRERDVAERAPGGGCVASAVGQAAFRLQPCLLRQVKSDLVIDLAVGPCRERREPDERSTCGPA